VTRRSSTTCRAVWSQPSLIWWRQLKPQATISAPGGSLGYSYDAAGRRTAVTYPDGSTVISGYDPAGRLASLTDTSGTITYTHDDDGRVQ